MKKIFARMHGEEGFTLVELLIVVAIIAILAAIAIPQFSKYRQRGYITEINSDAKNAYTASQAYLSDNPGATVSTLAMLKSGGYAQSPNVVSLGTWAMTLSSGNIQLKTTAALSSTSKNNVLIHANGRINQAK